MFLILYIVMMMNGFAESDTRIYSACYGSYYESLLNSSCADVPGTVIAVHSVNVGSKLKTDSCPLYRNSLTNESCCYPDDEDCIFEYSQSYFYDKCNGRVTCLETQVAWEQTGSKCGNKSSLFMDQTNYMFMNYSCVESTKRGSFCTTVSTTMTNNEVFNIYNRDYPSQIAPADDNCSCSIETSSCDVPINIYKIQVNLTGGNGSCWQSVKLIDGNVVNTLTCNDNSLYNTSVDTSSTSYLAVTLSNTANQDGGYIWFGFQSSDASASMSINCPAVPTRLSCPWNTSTTSSPAASSTSQLATTTQTSLTSRYSIGTTQTFSPKTTFSPIVSSITTPVTTQRSTTLSSITTPVSTQRSTTLSSVHSSITTPVTTQRSTTLSKIPSSITTQRSTTLSSVLSSITTPVTTQRSTTLSSVLSSIATPVTTQRSTMFSSAHSSITTPVTAQRSTTLSKIPSSITTQRSTTLSSVLSSITTPVTTQRSTTLSSVLSSIATPVTTQRSTMFSSAHSSITTPETTQRSTTISKIPSSITTQRSTTLSSVLSSIATPVTTQRSTTFSSAHSSITTPETTQRSTTISKIPSPITAQRSTTLSSVHSSITTPVATQRSTVSKIPSSIPTPVKTQGTTTLSSALSSTPLTTHTLPITANISKLPITVTTETLTPEVRTTATLYPITTHTTKTISTSRLTRRTTDATRPITQEITARNQKNPSTTSPQTTVPIKSEPSVESNVFISDVVKMTLIICTATVLAVLITVCGCILLKRIRHKTIISPETPGHLESGKPDDSPWSSPPISPRPFSQASSFINVKLPVCRDTYTDSGSDTSGHLLINTVKPDLSSQSRGRAKVAF